MKREWTPDQQNAINARGGSVLVSAAAGSGKTAVLVERIIRRITDEANPVPADRLLVATYTNAAANEMRERIEARLMDLIRADRGNAFLARQQALLARANIGTIHSFCLNLLRENADLMGLDSAFRLADESEIGTLAEEALSEILEESYAAGDADFLRLTQMFSDRDDRALGALIQKIYDFIRSFPHPQDWLDEKLQIYDQTDIDKTDWKHLLTERAYDELMYHAVRMEQLADKLKDAGELRDHYYDTFLMDAQVITDLARIVENAPWDDIVYAAEKLYFPTLPRVKGYPDEATKKAFQNKRNGIKKNVADLMKKYFPETKDEFAESAAYLRPIVACLFKLVKQYYDRLDAKKAEKSLLDFSDLELLSIRLLTKKQGRGYTKSELAEQLSAQFEEILLDEYQDTNAAQDALFTALSRNRENLFMVGDVKQSIYGFRNAMPQIFMRRKKTYRLYDGERYPARIDLSNNFRSRSQVTSFINFVFAQIMSPRLGDVSYTKREQLNPKGSYYEKDADTELCILDLTDVDRETQEMAEANYIAHRISDMLSAGYTVQGKDGQPRLCTPGDFSILLRSTKHADRYVKALQQYGVSAYAESNASYFDTREISMLLNLLRIIDNPLDDIAFLSVILSPAFAFTPDEAAATRLCAPDAPFYLAFCAYAEQNPRAKAFLEMLARLRKQSALVGVGELIREIYDTTDLFAAAGAMPSGERRQANLRKFCAEAIRYEEVGGDGLSGFIRYIRRMIDRGDDLKQANTAATADAVQIMSIHRSKGLEFPICIVAECAKQFNKMDQVGNAVLHRNYGVACNVILPEELKRYPTAYSIAVRQAIEDDTLSEEMRVLYVALTRAKEKLMLTCAFKDTDRALKRILDCRMDTSLLPIGMLKKANSYADWLIAAAVRHPNAEELRRRADVRCSVLDGGELQIHFCTPEALESVSDDLPKPEKADATVVAQIKADCAYEYPYQRLSECVSKLAVTQLAKDTAKRPVKLKARPNFIEQTGMTAAERGTVAHKFMQFADFDAAKRDLSAEAARLEREGYLADYEIAVLDLQKLQTFFDGALMDRILDADAVYREYGFFDEISAETVYGADAALAEERVLIQGIADCVIVKDGAACVIDYKTDSVTDPQVLIDRYQSQLSLYATALSKSLSVPVTEKIIYSISLGKAISVE